MEQRALIQPGPGSAAQRRRERELPAITHALTLWGKQHGMPMERVAASAYVGVCATPASAEAFNSVLAFHLAQLPLWIFGLDYYLDAPVTTPEEQQIAQRMLSLLRPLAQHPAPYFRFGRFAGLAPELAQTHSDAAGVRIGEAWLQLYQSLAHAWVDAPERDYCLDLVTANTADLLAAMWGEARQDCLFRASGQQPDLDTYLKLRHSIGFLAVGAIACGFELEPRVAWTRWLPALEAACRIVRLANDGANVLRELAEGKVNSMTILLAGLGHDPRGPYVEDSQPLVAARSLLRSYLDNELAQFGKLVKDLPHDGPLGCYVTTCTALGIAMYQDGDLEIPRH